MNNTNLSESNGSRNYFVNFNQDVTSLAVGCRNGYRLFSLNNVDQLEQIYSNGTEDSCVVERLFSSSLVAVVSLAAPRKLKVCHFKKGTEICNYSYSNTILAVKLNRARLVVCLEEALYIHNIRDMKVLHTIRDTPPNPSGLCALTINNTENCYLAYPGSSSIGEVQIFDANNLHAKTMIPAHDSPLAALAFSPNGRRIATASEKGTVIRVFNVADGAKLYEFRRGVKRCVAISCLAFSMCGQFLGCSSNTETVHVFKLEEPRDSPRRSVDESSWMGYLSNYLPTQVTDVFNQGRAFATAHLPISGVRNVISIVTIQNQLRLLVATEDGMLFVYNMDSADGGDLTLYKQHRIDEFSESDIDRSQPRNIEGDRIYELLRYHFHTTKMAYMKYLEPSLQFITQFWRVTTTETTEETIIIGKCEVCQAETSRQCSSCKSTFYCSEEHQKKDWENHKIICNITPFEIVEISEGKKYLKAPKDLEPGEVILMETPVVFGPKTLRISEGSFPCVGCCRLISTTDCSKCPECSWPTCSLECAGLKDERYHGMECKVLRLRPPQLEVSFYDYYRFDILIALRTLFLQKLEINQWKEVMSLQSHMEKRGSETDVYKIVQEKAQFVEDNYLGLLRAYEHEIGEEILPAVPSDLIHKIYGIIHANSVEINIEEVSAQAIYSASNYIEHNCISCTSDQVDVQNQFQITFRATLPVKKEEHITSSYTDILLGTHARRLDLRQRKYIQSCSCDRCKDPTEMGSFVSALKCIGSETDPCGGTQLPLDPINEETDWKCDKCGILLPNNEIMKFVEHLGKEVEKVMVKDATLEEMEETLEKLMNFLNPNHYLVYRMKFSMIKMYDRVEVTEEVLQKKLKMCENLIDITKRIDPGNSKLTVYLSDLLNEHFKTKKLMLQRSFSMEKKEAVCSNINELLAILEGNKHILQYNSSDSKQSKIYLEVCENESQFKNWLSENNIVIEYQ